MRRVALLMAAMAGLLLAGCATTTTSGSTPPSPTLPPLQITRTGGFAGVHETLQISTDGQWSYTGGVRSSWGQLSESSRARLIELVSDPALPDQVAAATPDQCCDMFQYELRVGDKTYRFGEPDLGPLLVELLDILHEQTDF